MPNAGKARINRRKLLDYALNLKHDSGKYKAAFLAQMGYTASDWQRLEIDIREQHLTLPAEPGQPSAYGDKYTITGPLQGPSGLARQVTTVWLFRPGNECAELITIEPARRARRT